MRIPPVENPTCAAFGKYEEVPETVLLDLLEDDVTWVASKISGAAGEMGAEAIELSNWIFSSGVHRSSSESLLPIFPTR